MQSGLQLKLAQSDKGSWYFYLDGPSGATICFGPYRQEQEDARRDAVAFLFNMNQPHVIITLMDKRIAPHATVSNPQEDYLRAMIKATEQYNEKKRLEGTDPEQDFSDEENFEEDDTPYEPTPRKKGHLSLVE